MSYFPNPTDLELLAGEAWRMGQPIYLDLISRAGKLASAASLVTSQVIGFAVDDVPVGHVGGIATAAVFLADWSLVSGTANLAPGANYFLAIAPGMITTISPSAKTNCVVLLGIATSLSALKVSIQPPVLL
jgi:hypothetical protein